GPDVLALVVLDLDHAVGAAEDGVELAGEADAPRDRLEAAEVLELLGEHDSLRRPVRSLDRGREGVDRGRAGYEAAGRRRPNLALDGIEEAPDGWIRVVAEDRGEGDVPVLRHLGVLGVPVRAVSGPGVHDRGLHPEAAHALHDLGPVAERGRGNDQLST